MRSACGNRFAGSIAGRDTFVNDPLNKLHKSSTIQGLVKQLNPHICGQFHPKLDRCADRSLFLAIHRIALLCKPLGQRDWQFRAKTFFAR